MFRKRVLHFDVYVKRRVRSEPEMEEEIVWGVQEISSFAFSESLLVLSSAGWITDCQNAAGISKFGLDGH